ncbi:phage tail-collar fiber domain-containing protein [Stutzerimonas balearica]|uniref:phage tail-collar fiber domain-containing protein n=1 Tax=Stutzerimonas balearica TaxID=74829 RepID=UPI0028ADEB63|nr:phage tail protein [Stutzerimonas balearica]
MGASITIAGERLIAQKQADRQPLEVARFVLAYLPGLDTTQPVDRDAGLPPAEQIVYSVDISRDGAAGPNGELTREGYLSPNQVVYSLLMGTNIGDFDFNWIGLQTIEDVLLIAAYVPRQQKRREIPPLQTGNNLTRNIVLEYDGAQSLTGIEVPAASWQFDFTAQFAAMNTQIAALQAELEKKVDAASWNPPQSVSLDGPVLVYPGSSNTYQITDFDAFAVYQASSTVGSVTLAGDVLTLDVPAEAPEGLATLEVMRSGAKATFKIPVGSATIDQPAITSPANGAVDVSFEPDLQATAFTVFPAGHDSHAETHWQLARDAAFTDLLLDQQGADNLTAISLAALGIRLDPATRYYARARYIGTTLASAWSAAVAFNTAAVYVNKPTFSAPLDGAADVGETPTLTTSAFLVSGGTDNHQSTDWEIRTGPDGTGDLVWSSLGNTANRTTISVPAGVLQVSTAYYLRARHRSYNYGASSWAQISVMTKSAFLPTVPGEAFGGGYYAGRMRFPDGDYLLIVAPKAAETTLANKSDATSTSGTTSIFDGWANSNAMNNSSHPAARHCRTYTGGGYTDWYLPARDELEVLYRNLKPSTSENYPGTRDDSLGYGENANSVPVGAAYTAGNPAQTGQAAFRSGAAEAFNDAGTYWSSTQHSTWANAWIQRFSNGMQISTQKYAKELVRPVRRVKI